MRNYRYQNKMFSILLLLILLLLKSFQSLENNKLQKENQLIPTELLKARPEHDSDSATILETYEKAVQAYLFEDWDACIHTFRQLIYKYERYKNAIIDCRLKCRDRVSVFNPKFRENIEDLHFYEKKIKETLCLLTCNQEYRELVGKQSLKRLALKEERKLITAEHYGYLHNCYYQKKYYQEAANAAFTYLIHHPDHEATRLSLAYYASIPDVDNNTIINLKAEPFVQYYKIGVEAYIEGNYHKAIKNFEESLDLYFKSDQRCRYYCEGPFEQDWNPEFTTALANHFVSNLRCKRRCSNILNTIDGAYRKDFLANHYNYLQFAYYKSDNLEETCKTVESYLLFYPADETMLHNKQFYASLSGVNMDFFNPRKDCLFYVKRQEYEKHLFVFIQDEFEALEKKIMTSDNKEASSEENWI